MQKQRPPPRQHRISIEEPAAAADEGATANPDAAEASFPILRSSELFDYDLRTVSGDSIGTVSDIVIQLNEGRIDYAILAVGGFFGFGDDLLVAPWELLVIDPLENSITLNADPVALETAPRFDGASLSSIYEPNFQGG